MTGMKESMETKNVAALQVTHVGPYVAAYAFDFGVIVAAYAVAAAYPHWLTYTLCVLVLGTRQHAIAILAHEGAHRLISRNPMINRVMTELGAWPLFLNAFEGYREWHMEHHRHLGGANDPEKEFFDQFPAYEAPVGWKKMAVRLVLDLVGFATPEVLKFTLRLLPRRKVHMLGPVLLWAAALGAAYYFDALWIPLLWVIALHTSFWASFRMRNYVEHVGETAGPGHEGSHRYHAGPIARFCFLPHNVWYHYEHHMHASVPFFNLPKLRPMLGQRPVLSFGEMLAHVDRLPARAMGGA